MNEQFEMGPGLIIWQIIIFLLLVFVVYLLVRFYKLITTYFNLKIKYIQKKLDSE